MTYVIVYSKKTNNNKGGSLCQNLKKAISIMEQS